MNELIDKAALALLEFETGELGQQFPGVGFDADGWPSLVSEKGKEYWRQKARVVIKAIRDPTYEMIERGYRDYCAPDLKQSWHAMIDEAIK